MFKTTAGGPPIRFINLRFEEIAATAAVLKGPNATFNSDHGFIFCDNSHSSSEQALPSILASEDETINPSF